MITLRQLLSSEILDILKDKQIIKIYPSEFKENQILDVRVR